MIPIKLLETREQGTFDHEFHYWYKYKLFIFVVVVAIYTVEGASE